VTSATRRSRLWCTRTTGNKGPEGVPIRMLLSARLIDVAPVTSPAYPDATVGLRSLARFVDAPIEDVIKRAKCNELRGFFARTDTPELSARAPSEMAEQHRRLTVQPTPTRIVRAGKSAREALLQLQEKRWPVYGIGQRTS
jgi:hypothetical protein